VENQPLNKSSELEEEVQGEVVDQPRQIMELQLAPLVVDSEAEQLEMQREGIS